MFGFLIAISNFLKRCNLFLNLNGLMQMHCNNFKWQMLYPKYVRLHLELPNAAWSP